MAITNHVVTISRAGNTLSVDQDPKQVKFNDRLSFTCTEDFAVFFKNNRNPHSNSTGVLSEHGGNTTARLAIRHLTKGEKLHHLNPLIGDKFSYGIAVRRPDTNNVVTLDPAIIVDDTGGGGGGGHHTKPKKAAAKT